MPAKPSRRLPVLFVCALSPAGAEPFIGQFELKTLDSEPGSFEFQSQNAWTDGQPQRRIDVGSNGLTFDENAVVRARHALELEIGLTSALKMRVGVEFEKERLEAPETPTQANAFGDMELTELGVELIAIFVPRESDGAGLGFVAELERPMEEEESSNLVLGPILEWQSGRWFAAAVPMLVYAFGGDAEAGESIDTKWDFAYAAQVKYAFSPSWTFALEGYGTVERLGSTGHPSESAELFGDFDQHRLGPILYYARSVGGETEEPNLSIGLGVLEGLNGNTPDHTLKFSIELDF